MKAYVTSIGEKTTEICCDQLKRYGFDVVLLDEKEPWIDKYKRFINMADGDCLRVDADIIVNEHIKDYFPNNEHPRSEMMEQFMTYDLYRNKTSITCPVFYSKEGLKIIKKNMKEIDIRRPEASAWRLLDINLNTITWGTDIVGMHGFFQDDQTIARAKKNKEDRGQIDDYDFELVNKLRSL